MSLSPSSNGEIHFFSNLPGIPISEQFIVPVIFFSVVLVMSLPSQLFGRLANENKSLEFYVWDIVGSLFGILFFTLNSYLGTEPIVWFLIVVIVYLILFYEKSRRYLIAMFGCLLFVAILIPTHKENIFWSPYQKIEIVKTAVNESDGTTSLAYRLFVNNIGHQTMVGNIKYKEWFYAFPYEVFPTSTFSRVLVIGAGTGTDVAVALSHGAQQVDAVEIDPKILDLGRMYNPDKPYNDVRVHTYNMDARTFLEQTKNKYDLVIYALPDSLVLASQHSNIRLESFLFTKESFIAAKQTLTPNGLLVLYNYYRQPWLIDKMAGMLEDVFQQKTYMKNTGGPLYAGILMTGGEMKNALKNLPQTMAYDNKLPPATDSWPFLYLLHRTIPVGYLSILFIIMLVVYKAISRLVGSPLIKVIQPSYFFLGAAFMLLESKSVVAFSLLFGSTWMVNALVFFAILVSVLLSILWAQRQSVIRIKYWYFALFGILLLNYLVPENFFLAWPLAQKYLAVSILTFSPIFCANIIFASLFKTSSNNANNFASNILGAAFGGVLEYFTLLVGYHQIIILIMILYYLVFRSYQINQKKI